MDHRNGFTATAWNNGSWSRTGAGYGLKITSEDRDRHFDRDWNAVTLHLMGERTSRVAEANLAKDSFWDAKCRELIKVEIGQWFSENGFDRWTRGDPPRFRMRPLGRSEFEVTACNAVGEAPRRRTGPA